jgi:hypothetical protein
LVRGFQALSIVFRVRVIDHLGPYHQFLKYDLLHKVFLKYTYYYYYYWL